MHINYHTIKICISPKKEISVNLIIGDYMGFYTLTHSHHSKIYVNKWWQKCGFKWTLLYYFLISHYSQTTVRQALLQYCGLFEYHSQPDNEPIIALGAGQSIYLTMAENMLDNSHFCNFVWWCWCHRNDSSLINCNQLQHLKYPLQIHFILYTFKSNILLLKTTQQKTSCSD